MSLETALLSVESPNREISIQKTSKNPSLKRVKGKPKPITRQQLEIIVPSFKRAIEKQEAKNIDYDNIKKLFTHKHAKKLYSRQADVIRKLTSIYRDGIVF